MDEYKLIMSSDPRKFEKEINDFFLLMYFLYSEVHTFTVHKDQDNMFYAHIFFKTILIKDFIHQQILKDQRAKKIKEDPELLKKIDVLIEHFKLDYLQEEVQIPC